MSSPPRASVSHDRCVGVGMCVQHAPRSFRLNKQGQAEYVEDGEVSGEALEDAADSCPMSAIGLGAQDPDPRE